MLTKQTVPADRCNSPRPCGRGSPLLPGDHDELGPGLRSALDPRLLLFYLDLPGAPAHHGDQVRTAVMPLRRKLKPYRMLWWVASTGFHILLLSFGLASTTTISSSYLHIDQASHVKPVVFLSLILAILIIFEVTSHHISLIYCPIFRCW